VPNVARGAWRRAVTELVPGNPEPANYTLSPASATAYSDSGKTVTITMKGWKWPDGETVDAADVALRINTEK
jgi:ABC-type transport system substrate-binding protein